MKHATYKGIATDDCEKETETETILYSTLSVKIFFYYSMLFCTHKFILYKNAKGTRIKPIKGY